MATRDELPISDLSSPQTDSWRRIVLENALDAVVGIDQHGSVIDWNQQASVIFGWTREQALGQQMADLIIPPEYRRGHSEGMKRFLATREPHILNRRVELAALHRSGVQFPVELTVIPIPLGDGYHFYSFIRDISEQKRTAAELVLKSDALENSLNGFDIVDAKGQFIYANRAYLKMWGYESLEEVLKTSPASHCVDTTVPERIIRSLQERGECDIEFVARRKDGSTFDVHMWARLAWDSEGNEIYPTTSIDVTEAKKARQALIVSEEQFHATFDYAPVGIVNTSPCGHFLSVNSKFCEMLGYTSEELHSLRFSELTHPEDRAVDQQMVKQLFDGQLGTYSREKRYLRKDGTVLWAQVTGRALFQSDGQPRHSVTIVQDISARKQSEERRQLLEEQLSFLSDMTKELLAEPLGYQERIQKLVHSVVPKLADWCIVDVLDADLTPRYAAIAHRDPAKVEFAYELRRKYPIDPNRPVGAAHVMKTRTSDLYPTVSEPLLRSLSPDEEYFELVRQLGLRSFMCIPIQAHGEVMGALTLVSESRTYGAADLTFAQELANRAAFALYNSRLYDDAQKAVRLRDEFLSIASHELKTPLTSLKLQTQIAKRKFLSGDSRVFEKESVSKLIEVTDRQVDRLGRLVEDMLDISRIVHGKLTLQPEKVDLGVLVRDVVDRLTEQMRTAGCRYKLDLESDLIGYWDRYRIEQVVINLISNAMKYGAGKPIEIGVTSSSGRAVLNVRDHGMGIDKQNLEKIFQRFERAVSAANISGLGLGLYISRQIVDAHGGTVQVESESEKGSIFTVTLPLMPDVESDAQ